MMSFSVFFARFSFTPFDPSEDTESGGGAPDEPAQPSFTPFDPSEDTESDCIHSTLDAWLWFHPIRSV